MKAEIEMNYCRRCGQSLTKTEKNIYKCPSGHTLYVTSAPTASVLFVNSRKEILIAIRKDDPGKGKYDMPGGFCDGLETFEDCLVRELKEELNLNPDDYENPEFLLSCNDTYDYQGEILPILCGVYTARLKPSANPQPADDVAGVKFLKYDEIDQSKVHFPSLIAGLKALHKRGTI